LQFLLELIVFLILHTAGHDNLQRIFLTILVKEEDVFEALNL